MVQPFFSPLRFSRSGEHFWWPASWAAREGEPGRGKDKASNRGHATATELNSPWPVFTVLDGLAHDGPRRLAPSEGLETREAAHASCRVNEMTCDDPSPNTSMLFFPSQARPRGCFERLSFSGCGSRFRPWL
ncbi:hypothetical protein BD289DRAFT_143969 [Coniella lustricola]|uniref:Uncharacterized protein n=1 Tax=Coniella lustricola TaxID=2025994 RepID=A0A2T3AEY2_9PEZI|nr:hypothetical protein BD289DRAFT_143969 [Coniella lustricola]